MSFSPWVPSPKRAAAEVESAMNHCLAQRLTVSLLAGMWLRNATAITGLQIIRTQRKRVTMQPWITVTSGSTGGKKGKRHGDKDAKQQEHSVHTHKHRPEAPPDRAPAGSNTTQLIKTNPQQQKNKQTHPVFGRSGSRPCPGGADKVSVLLGANSSTDAFAEEAAACLLRGEGDERRAQARPETLWDSLLGIFLLKKKAV